MVAIYTAEHVASWQTIHLWKRSNVITMATTLNYTNLRTSSTPKNWQQCIINMTLIPTH